MFSTRFVKADHYMNSPIPGLDVRYSEFRASEVKQVPVIRIFGSSTSGCKVCLHIHGVFPYFYIPYDESIEKNRFRYQIASALDKALNISLGNSNSRTQHVYKISLVSGIPLYGFHSNTHQFLKIYLYNPLLVKKATDLLQNGVILGQAFQPHEAHLPFILQFCIDYNIHGMSLVHLSAVRYRRASTGGLQNHAALLDSVPEELLLPDNIARISTCSLEVDGIAGDILNHKEISGNLTRNPGLKAIWDEECERRRAEMRSSQITPMNSQSRPAASSIASEVFYLERLKKRLVQLASLRSSGQSLEPSPLGDKPQPYPAETREEKGLMEASFLETHVSSLATQTPDSGEQLKDDQQNSDVLVDREVILSLTANDQNVPQSPDDSILSLVQVLQELIEEDSVLGSQSQRNEGNEGNDSDLESVEGDPMLSQTLDLEQMAHQHSTIVHGPEPADNLCNEVFTIPQLDGTNDLLKDEELHDPQPGPSGLNRCNQPADKTSSFPTLGDEDELDEISLAFKGSVDCETMPLELGEGTDGESQKEIYTGNFSAFRLDDTCNPAISIPVGSDTSSNTEYNFGHMKPGEPLENYLIADPWMTVAPNLSERDELLESAAALSGGEDLWGNEGEASLWPSDFVQTNLPTVAELACGLEPSVLSELSPIKAVPSLDCSINSDTSSETKRRLSSLIKSRTKAKEARNAMSDLQDMGSDVEENECANPVQFPPNFAELVDVDNMQALLNEIGEGEFLSDELVNEAKFPCSSVEMDALELQDNGLLVQLDSAKRKKSARARNDCDGRKNHEAKEDEGKPCGAERKRRGRRAKNSKEDRAAATNPSRLATEEKNCVENDSEEVGRVKLTVDHCCMKTITIETDIQHQNAQGINCSSQPTVKEKLGMHIRKTLRSNRNANVHQSAFKPEIGTVQNATSHNLGTDPISGFPDVGHLAHNSFGNMFEIDLVGQGTSGSSLNGEVSSSSDKFTAMTGQLGHNDKESKKEIGLYVRQKLGMLVGSRTKLRAAAASSAVSDTARGTLPLSTADPETERDSFKQKCQYPKQKLKSAIIESSQSSNDFQRVLFSERQEHDIPTSVICLSDSENILNNKNTAEVKSELEPSANALKLHSIYPCYVKLKRCNQNGSSETEMALLQKSANEDEDLVIMLNPPPKEVCESAASRAVTSLHGIPVAAELSGPMNFDANHAAEFIMNCVIPKSSNTACKNAKKANREIGSLKAVVQAESPRVADTLDSLPENPLHNIHHYAPGVGTILGVTDVASIHSEREDTSAEIPQVHQALLCDDILKSDHNQNKTLFLCGNKDELSYLQECKTLPCDVNNADEVDEEVFEDLLSFTRVQNVGRLWPTEGIGDRFVRKKKNLSETAAPVNEAFSLIDSENQTPVSECNNVLGTGEECVGETVGGWNEVEPGELCNSPEEKEEKYRPVFVIKDINSIDGNDKNIKEVSESQNVGTLASPGVIPPYLRGFPRIRLRPPKILKKKRLFQSMPKLERSSQKTGKQKKPGMGGNQSSLSSTSNLKHSEGRKKNPGKQISPVLHHKKGVGKKRGEVNSERASLNIVDKTSSSNCSNEIDKSNEKEQEVRFSPVPFRMARTSKNENKIHVTGQGGDIRSASTIVNESTSSESPEAVFDKKTDVVAFSDKVRPVKKDRTRSVSHKRNVNSSRTSSTTVNISDATHHNTSDSISKSEANSDKRTEVLVSSVSDSKTKTEEEDRKQDLVNRSSSVGIDVNVTATDVFIQSSENASKPENKTSKRRRILKKDRRLDPSCNRNADCLSSSFTCEDVTKSTDSESKKSFKKGIKKQVSFAPDERTNAKKLRKTMRSERSVEVDGGGTPSGRDCKSDGGKREQEKKIAENVLGSLREVAPAGCRRACVHAGMDTSNAPGNLGKRNENNKSTSASHKSNQIIKRLRRESHEIKRQKSDEKEVKFSSVSVKQSNSVKKNKKINRSSKRNEDGSGSSVNSNTISSLNAYLSPQQSDIESQVQEPPAALLEFQKSKRKKQNLLTKSKGKVAGQAKLGAKVDDLVASANCNTTYESPNPPKKTAGSALKEPLSVNNRRAKIGILISPAKKINRSGSSPVRIKGIGTSDVNISSNKLDNQDEPHISSATNRETRTIEYRHMGVADKKKVKKSLAGENYQISSSLSVPPEPCIKKRKGSIEKKSEIVSLTLKKLRNIRLRSSSLTVGTNSSSDVNTSADQTGEGEGKLAKASRLFSHTHISVRQDSKPNQTSEKKINISRSLSFSDVKKKTDYNECRTSSSIVCEGEKNHVKEHEKQSLFMLGKKSQFEKNRSTKKCESKTNISLKSDSDAINVTTSESSQITSERSLKYAIKAKVLLKPVKVVLHKLDAAILSKYHSSENVEKSMDHRHMPLPIKEVNKVSGSAFARDSTDSSDSDDSSYLPLSLLTPQSTKKKGCSSQLTDLHCSVGMSLKLKSPKFLKRKCHSDEKNKEERVKGNNDALQVNRLIESTDMSNCIVNRSASRRLGCSPMPSNKRSLLLPMEVQRKTKDKQKQMRIPCVDGAMDSTDYDSSETDDDLRLEKERLEGKQSDLTIAVDNANEISPSSHSSSDSAFVPKSPRKTLKKNRYRPLEVVIKKSPHKKKTEKGATIRKIPKLSYSDSSEDIAETSERNDGTHCEIAFTKYIASEKQKRGVEIDRGMFLPVVLLERISPSVATSECSHNDELDPSQKGGSCSVAPAQSSVLGELCKNAVRVEVHMSTIPDIDGGPSALHPNILSVGRELLSKGEEQEGLHSIPVSKEGASASLQPRGDAPHFPYQKSLALHCEDSLPSDKSEISDLKCSHPTRCSESLPGYDFDRNSSPLVPAKQYHSLDLLQEKSENGRLLEYETGMKEKTGSLRNLNCIDTEMKLKKTLDITERTLTISTRNVYYNHVISLKYGPPSTKEVLLSLNSLKLPLHKFLHPYFSIASDVAERKEVGGRSLRVPSCSMAEFEMFQSSLPDIMSLAEQRAGTVACLLGQTQLRDMKAALASQREIVLVPCCGAPSVSDVKRWTKARSACKEFQKEQKKENKEKFEKLLLIIPASPGSDFSEDTSLSLIPLSQSTLKDHDADIAQVHSSNPISPEGKVDNEDNSSTRKTKELTSLGDSPKDPETKASQESGPSLQHLVAQTQFRQQFDTPRAGNRSVRSNESIGFKMSYENLQDARAVVEHQYLTLLVLELHVQTRSDLCSDPAYDPVCAAFYAVQNDVPEDSSIPQTYTGMIVVRNSVNSEAHDPLIHVVEPLCKCHYVPDERALLQEVVNLVLRWDPDILAGYEVEMHSWGYLFQRAFTLELNLCPMVSRVPSAHQGPTINKTPDETIVESSEEITLVGRIMLNGWRLMRHEVALQSYTFENVAFHILHERLSLVPSKVLTQWWGHRTRLYWGRVADHYLIRVRGLLRIFDQLDLINRTAELARIFGIQFYEVLSRGSQFRVESMMLRLAKPSNYIAVSPSVQQRARMRAPEHLQLIMEPESRLYVDPVIVLDFQSLYPSMIIAYNYCYSTCLGRVEHLGQSTPFEFGCSHLRVPPSDVERLMNNLNISPCGAAFVNATIRKGILPQMLQEILDTRLMVKKSMKEHKDQKTLLRVLHSRQLGLKLIANVTYGYTAANFSGRMACVEVGDSVVSKGRETLERAIHLVENTPRWGARVVYGDTDSLFVLVPGRSRQDAFAIGAQIAEAVTQDNPRPVKLKLEKVYQPCLLQTKKRYVGYMYESSDQKDPVYDAKGIETVRRDGCPAVAKVLERSIRLLFETRDVSHVKSYVQRQFSKLLDGSMSLQDLIFAREFRGTRGYKPGACVPALELTKRWLHTDPRAEPRVGERVPYVVASGPPNVPLIQLVRSPHELLHDPGLKVHSHYYVSRVLCPPLDRCLSLIGVDVQSWYTELPRKMNVSLPVCAPPTDHKKSTISQYFSTVNCAACSQVCQTGLCLDCLAKPHHTAVILSEKVLQWERNYYNLEKLCQSCCGLMDKVECVSLDCPVLYRRCKAWKLLQQESYLQTLLDQF